MCRFILACAAGLLGAAVVASADTIFVPVGDFVGFRTTPAGVGVSSTGGSWADANEGVRIKWNISESGGVFTYVYTLSAKDGNAFDQGAVSHFLLETSSNFTSSDILAGSSTVAGGGPATYGPSQGNSNPNIPGNIFGLKFDFGSLLSTYTLKTTRRPIWGDWYAKDGNAGGGTNSAWNASFGSDPTASTTDFVGWVPTPDTAAAVVPLPMAAWMGMALLGGAGAFSFIRRRRYMAD